ncbi:MAG: SusD/RagB family nutrient-binding outer membrane lipoprotein, partial [Ignavibacteria bacterium]|nr:SusD/RagB family nutrient-binding outer membrane lipoprotein [Ignavibacteria bacterium]
PILLSSYVNFMIAEASIAVPGFIDSARARNQFEAGINASIDKVTNFIPDYPVLTAPEQTILNNNKVTYPVFMLTRFDSASSTVKLEIIMKEYYLASWGNGIEPYNNYRRTGYPSNFQPTVEPTSGDYYYTAFYSGNAVNNNPNTPSNLRSRKVFWDKANIILH